MIGMIAQMQEEIGGLRRELHDAGRRHGARARPEEGRLTDQERQLRAQARSERRRFDHDMRRLDREEEKMRQQEEHENFKAAHALQMEEFERAKMGAKVEQEREKIKMNDLMAGLNLIAEAGQQSLHLTKQL